MAHPEPDRPYFLLDEQLVEETRSPGQVARATRIFAICCVAATIAQIGYSVYTNLAFVLAAPPGLPLVVIGTIVTATVVGVLSIPLLYGWKSLGWYLAVGFFTFEGSFILLLGNRYLLFGEPFSLTDLAENLLQPELVLEIVTAMFACCLPLLLCWRSTVRKAFSVHTSRAIVVVFSCLILRILFFVITYVLYRG
ncbi:hypothetical protein [Neolewinella sp.]|uniref:hypothetical protein n=1 Tax=Neolewinella sp. TaxID=2993543 RepID=UPI003B517231